MPRRSKGPRLYLDPVERVWVIRDGARKRRTGCAEGELGRAEEKLRDFIGEKYASPSDRHPTRILIADALTFYSREIVPGQASRERTDFAIRHLADWWADRKLADVKGTTCRAYVAHRTSQPIPQAKSEEARKRLVSQSTARRELVVLQAAINAYHAEHSLEAVPVVSLPDESLARDRWLMRSEAAAFLRAARKHPHGPVRRALSRFFLIAIYTGSRSAVIRKLAWMPSTGGAWVDLTSGVMHRRGAGERETKKRRPPVRIPVRLLGHMRRWKAADEMAGRAHVVDMGFGPVSKQRRAWAWVRSEAGLGPDVVPHVTRHTAATWMMQSAMDLWDASAYLGMSPEILWRVYGHHHPDWQKDSAERIGRR